MPGYVLTTPPTEQLLTIEQARRHLAVDHDCEDDDIADMVRGAVQEWEDQTGHCIAVQGWELTLDRFPREIRIGKAPIIGVPVIKYTDLAGAEQTLPTTDYQVDTRGEPARIRPAYGKLWPQVRDEMNAIRVTFQAGYEVLTSVPANIVSAVKLILRHRYDNRSEVVTGTIAGKLPKGAEAIAASYRVSWF